AFAEAIAGVSLLTNDALPFSQSPPRSSYWNLRLIDAQKALGKLPKKDGKTDWGNIKVGHVDTGYVAHSVFGQWESTPAADGGNTCTNKTIRWQVGKYFMDGDSNPEDPLTYVPMRLPPDVPGHGLRTGSVLSGDKIGVAPGLPVVPCRAVRSVVLMTDAARGRVAGSIDHLVAAGCQVISISLGGMSGGEEMGQALDRAYMAGVIVCAAGGQYTDTVTYPGRYFRTIGVGGVQPKDRKILAAHAAAENFKLEIYNEYVRGGTRHIAGDDQFIDIWAPSACIDRAVAEADSARNLSSTDGGGGTSCGTVHVAATAAMWLRLKAANIGAKYGAGNWRRVEAFRRPPAQHQNAQA
ncbi:MAG: S8/S53 family peptidase, partial [Alphaproteobacteria bacterium]